MKFFNFFSKKKEDFVASELRKEKKIIDSQNIKSSTSYESYNDKNTEYSEINNDSDKSAKKLLASIMDTLEEGSEEKEILKEKLKNNNFKTVNINVSNHIITNKRNSSKSNDSDSKILENVNDFLKDFFENKTNK